MTPSARLCPKCTTVEPIQAHEPVWLPDWACRACGYAVADQDGIPLFAPDLADKVHGFNPESFATLAAAENGHFWFEPRNRLITGLIARHFPQATRFLEVGCGTGMVLSAVARTRPWQQLVGSELHPRGLAQARKRLGEQARFVQMDARAIPARGAFDVVGAFDVLEHIAEDEQVLEEMCKAVAPGGGVVLAVPQHPMLWSQADDAAHHVRRYRRGELERKVEAAGFRVAYSGSYTAVLLPVMAASRLLRPLVQTLGIFGRSTDPRPADVEFRLPPLLNGWMRAVLQREVTSSLGGRAFPFGGSRIVVASRR